MILQALYDYYKRCDNLPAFGLEEKEIGFILVIDKDGHFLRIEDARIDKNRARTYLVKKQEGRTSGVKANYLYDSCDYVLGYSQKDNGKEQLCFDAFKTKVKAIADAYPESEALAAVSSFYDNSREEILEQVSNDPLWADVQKNLNKRYSRFSFRLDGDTQIIAQKQELITNEEAPEGESHVCLVTGRYGTTIEVTTATMIPGSQATAKLVAFQVGSGYDSYGKQKGANAPISIEAEFAYSTALNTMLAKDSRNKIMAGNRTFLFWSSKNNEVGRKMEESFFALFGFQPETKDNPNQNLEAVRKVFNSIYLGQIATTLEDRFYILGLAPNSARIAVVYWSETSLREFAGTILRHFIDMEVVDTRKEPRPYAGLRAMLGAVTLGGKQSDATPNLPEAVMKSIFQGLPYPATLFASCIRRIRAEQDLTPYGSPCRVAILKAYLNRKPNNNKQLISMLDKENINPGYLCGRLFAVLDKIQEDTYHIHSIQERYLNAASATPMAVFPTILKLSLRHAEKLNEGSRIYYEKLKQEIISKMPAVAFPAHLNLEDQGRFFVGFYHQRQDFFIKKDTDNQ